MLELFPEIKTKPGIHVFCTCAPFLSAKAFEHEYMIYEMSAKIPNKKKPKRNQSVCHWKIQIRQNPKT